MSLSKPLRKPRFKDWLVYILDNDLCGEDAKWKDRSRRTAIIRWPHKSRGTWTLEKDAKLFKMWAITSGKYRASIDVPNPKSWKCNFRMNLNICKNIVELKQERIPKGANACRVYKFLDRRTNFLLPCPYDYGRNRYHPTQTRECYPTEGYGQVMMQDNPGPFHNGLHDINPTLSGVTNTEKYLYPIADIEEIPQHVIDEYCSLSQPPIGSETGLTRFEPANQDHPLNFQHQQTTSETSITSFEMVTQDHPINLQHPSSSSESSVTGFDQVEEDSLKSQIDSFRTTELNKLADTFANPPDFCETHM